MITLDSKVPLGPLETKWDRHRFSEKLVSPTNKRKVGIIVVGSGLAGTVLPWMSGGAAVLFAAGLYLALLGSPPDYQQGDTVRIMYIHVPSSACIM
jgi:hypothetical protein